MKKIISLILILASMFSIIAVTASAAEEEFISEVALIYRDSIEEAQAAISGTDWKLLEYDLNKKADYWFDDGVYLIYKTTTNVEEAITDLRVMDMYGGFSTSNYQSELEKSRSEYLAQVKSLRKVAEEFKACYDAGSPMARLAYRQLNYYKDVKTEGGTETGKLMGDFFLNMPPEAENDKIIQVLMQGNRAIVENLIALLAIGISGEGNDTLANRVTAKYAIKDTLTDIDYYTDTVAISKELTKIRAKILRYDALCEEFDLTDEEISEEEYQFIVEYAAISVLLDGIKLGNTTLTDVIRADDYEMKDLYPLTAALTEGQRALIAMGQLEVVLKYNCASVAIEDLEATLDAVEADYTDENGVFQTLDVYLGVDRELFEGNFAMTTAAARQQALTGDTWDFVDAMKDSIQPYAIAGIVSVFDAVIVGIIVSQRSNIYEVALWEANAPYLTGACVALTLIIVGLVTISTWYNYYNPSYTAIPNTMVDVRETSLGDHYVKYTAAKEYKGSYINRNADFNAFEGKEWIALYYTKDANAGNCLKPNFVVKENDNSVARRHQGISMFGETNAFNLNSHVYSDQAQPIYVTVRYSTAQKAAVNTPTVVGSIIATGALYALTGIVGVGVGVGGTLLVQKARKKKESDTDTDTDATPAES